MSLLLATLLPGLLLIVLGVPLLLNHSAFVATLKAVPRSTTATYLFFTAGAAWFLFNIWHLSPADFGDYRLILFIAFAAIAVLSFKCVPDFLAVRGLCILMLVCAAPLLGAAYMEHGHPQRLFMVSLVYLGIALAIWLGAQPWRLRDFFAWLFLQPSRTRALGGLLTAYGLLLSIAAFTY
ncbi:MAG TPA: hypothetical protein VHO24_08510 [Opitutaceae bacterium]|nr:hypothetical protein [Opitutaceae bacterium]